MITVAKKQALSENRNVMEFQELVERASKRNLKKGMTSWQVDAIAKKKERDESRKKVLEALKQGWQSCPKTNKSCGNLKRKLG